MFIIDLQTRLIYCVGVEDVDPDVGRFRNMVQSTVIAPRVSTCTPITNTYFQIILSYRSDRM